MKATRTLNPIHFEDLEPHRFEDLVRQLIYDFRNWKKLEATGRGGSDDGYDIRGWETVGNSSQEADDAIDSVDDINDSLEKNEDRLWLVQCKREKAIGPKKLEEYLSNIKSEDLYGLIFAAACDFSKQAKDLFNEYCHKAGIQECYLWGKAELEDLLFQPKNDHLLFAYFGISLQIRKRSLKSQINSIISIKRKASRCLGAINREHYKPILIRDAQDIHYPYKGDVSDFDEHPAWKLCYFLGYDHSGIKILARQYFAYVWEDGIHWDYVEEIDASGFHNDPWNDGSQKDDYNRLQSYWFKQPDNKKAWFSIIGIVPFDRIVAIDEFGDNITNELGGGDLPHLYVIMNIDGRLMDYHEAELRNLSRPPKHYNSDKSKIKKFFPDPIPELPDEPLIIE